MASSNADIHEIRHKIDTILATRYEELSSLVVRCVADVLKVTAADVKPHLSLVADLGLESLDYIELTFRLERACNIDLSRDDILNAVRMGLPNRGERDGWLAPDALERLLLLMPDLATSRRVDNIKAAGIEELFTVETYIRLVAWKLAEQVHTQVRAAQ